MRVMTLRQIKEAILAGDEEVVDRVMRYLVTLEIQRENALTQYSETQPTHLYRCQLMAASLESTVFGSEHEFTEDEEELYEMKLDDTQILV